MNLTLSSYISQVKSGKLNPVDFVNESLAKAKKLNIQTNAFVRFHEDYAIANISDFATRELCGAPIGIKDLVMTKWYTTSCASKILENYVPPYSATCFQKLEQAGGLMIGKTNCDQFGMWSSNENSHFGQVNNIYWSNRTPGGSSWWSAVAVASGVCLGAFGTETGGSARMPANCCNLVGLKPSYGRISRYGIAPYASSFDQLSLLNLDVQDTTILFSHLVGKDSKDATNFATKPWEIQNWKNFKKRDISKTKIAVPKQFWTDGLDNRIYDATRSTIRKLEKLWATVEEVDLPILEFIIPMYYILVTAELSANLARLDGVRFGSQDDTNKFADIKDYYTKIRSDWFLDETKRRILTWTFVLNSANYEWFYLQAQQAREVLKYEFANLYKKYDCIIGPVSPEVPWKLDSEKISDPVKMYLADIYTVTSNLAQNCSISVPNGFITEWDESLPNGIQIMADRGREDVLFGIWWVIESLAISSN